jgi:disease resistance protein RPM1
MYCGVTLAVWCLSSAAAENDMLLRLWYVLQNGLPWNKPELIQMVESLRLGYDDLPVHFKTCLLHCSIFPTDYKIERQGLVRKWITQGFFPKGPEQEKEAAAEACLGDLVSRGLLQQEPASSAGEKTSSRQV